MTADGDESSPEGGGLRRRVVNVGVVVGRGAGVMYKYLGALELAAALNDFIPSPSDTPLLKLPHLISPPPLSIPTPRTTPPPPLLLQISVPHGDNNINTITS